MVKYFARVGEHEYVIELDDGQIQVDGEPIDIDLNQVGESELYSVLFGGRSFELLIHADRFDYSVTLRNEQYSVQVEDERTRKLNAGRGVQAVPDGELAVRAPIPGLVVKVLTEASEDVEAGQPLLILEAMKMENEIRAPRGGTVKSVDVAPGQRVEQNAILMVLE